MTPLHPDAALDYGLLPVPEPVLECGTDGEGVLQLAPCARLYAWCRLVAIKAVWGRHGSYNPSAAIPTQKPAQRATVLYSLPCFGVTAFESVSIRDSAVAKARSYFDVTKTFLHTLQEAWVLAGVETAALPVSAAVLDQTTLATRCSIAMCVQQRVTQAMRYATWVGINVPTRTDDVAGPTLDYVFIDRDGLLHVTMVSMDGSASTTARWDVLSALVLVAQLPDVSVASVHVLYPACDDAVVVDTSAWRPHGLSKVLSVGMRPWSADQYVVYACCTNTHADLYDAFVNKDRKDGKDDTNGTEPYVTRVHTIDDLWDAVGVKRVVALRYDLFSGSDRRFDDRVQVIDGYVLDAGTVDGAANMDVRHVRHMYVTQRPVLPTLDFLRQYRHACTLR
jgi:hypothetical protein